jgi:putative spermidine/putrescine transport system permease protein
MALPAYATRGQKVTWLGLRVFGTFACFFLAAPILAYMPLSFNSGGFIYYPLEGYSLRWYVEFFHSQFWIASVLNSLLIGAATTLLATILGTLAALGLWHSKFPGRRFVIALLISPMIVPVVVTAIGIYFVFAPLGLTNTYAGMIAAHTMLASPFVVLTVGATLSTFDSTLLRAAGSLGAGPVAAFRRVMLPLILPGVISGALFAFATSFDEVVVAIFIAGPEQRTLPRQMFTLMNDNISLTITAVATMLTVVSIVLLTVMEALRRRSEGLVGPVGANRHA